MKPLLAALFAMPIALSAQVPGVIAPTENLVADGVPPIPAAIAAEVRRYTESRGAGLADWHPQRREMLISTRFGNTNQLHIVRNPDGARRQITFFDDPVNGGSFDPSGRYVLFGRDVGGNEFAQLYRHDLADGRVTLLTDGGRSQNGGVEWSRTGGRIAYGSTRRNGTDRDIYIMDPAQPTSDRMVLQVSGGGWGVSDWSPDGKQLLVQEFLSINHSKLWLVDASSGQKTLLTPEGPDTVSYAGGEFAADGKGIYVSSDRGSEFRQLSYVDLATRTFTPLTTDIKWDLDGFDVSPDGKWIAFAVNEAGISRVYLLETATRKYRPLSGIPTGTIGALTWHDNSRDLGLTVSSARSPSDAYSVDVTSGQVTRWTESELGGIVAAELSEPTLIRWKSFDGLEITAFYYKPPARFTGPRPVMINIHGGPEGQSRPGFLGRTNYYLNELGIAIISPNVRGSTGYGKTFVKLDNGLKRLDSVKDIGSLFDWIGRQPELDAAKVLVTGGSYGGYMTLAVATMYNDRIAAAVDVVGISNFVTFLQNTESYRRDLRRAEYGDEREPATREFFEKTAPLNNAGKISKPLFVVQGGNDPRVPRTESEQMVARVKQNGSPVWYLMGKDEGHGFRKKTNVDFQFYATVMFMRRFLLGEAERKAT